MTNNKKIILSAMLLAFTIVFARFLSIKTQFLVISLSFIPIMMSGIWLGSKYTMTIGALGDFIGAILFPFGTYFPGFTISAAISGYIYGAVLYNNDTKQMENKRFIFRLFISSFLVLVIVNILITSLWLHILYGEAYLIILYTRAITSLVMLPIQISVIYFLSKYLNPIVYEYLIEEQEEI